MSWLRADAKGVTLTLHIQPGAKHTAVAGMHGEALKIRLHAPPIEGQANAQLIAFLAQRLTVPKNAITLIAGASSRAKRLHIAGVSEVQARQALTEAS
jgi:uncharacterized protein (TIGR00251 family)